MENKFPISDEELQRLADWLKSDEGRKKIRESQEDADKVCKIIDSMNDIDPKILRTPFGPNGDSWEEAIKNAVRGEEKKPKLHELADGELKCDCPFKTNVELRADGKRYCGHCGKLYD